MAMTVIFSERELRNMQWILDQRKAQKSGLHWRAKLTEAKVRTIRQLWSGGNGFSIRRLALRFKVSTATISQEVRRDTWRWVK